MNRALLIGCFTTCLAAPFPSHAHEIHVSPSGPIKSLTEARDAVRTWRAGEGKDKAEPVRIIVAEGTYVTAAPIILEPQDSGTSASPVSYE
ncbi:MAG: hypothetical protein ACAH88_01745, partial [Roseimicrobium sp.]